MNFDTLNNREKYIDDGNIKIGNQKMRWILKRKR
jgi:hypothetical protein